MNPTDQLLVFADFFLKSTLVLALALVASRWWRGASAANRHLIWLAAFAVLLLAPCTRLLSPRWSWQPARVAAVAPVPAAEPAVATTVLLPSVTAVAPFAPPPLPRGQRAWPVWLAPRNGWLLLWGAGVLAILARLAAGAGRLWWWRRRSGPVPDRRLNGLCREIAVGYGLTVAVELRSLANCRVPMTWGTLRPVVLLPTDAVTWPDTRLALVLRHELGHIVRRDSLSRLLAQVVAALYWFNPLVWIGARALRLTQEQACDDLVLNAGTSAEAYALELVAAARRLQRERRIVPAVAMAEPSTLGRRIEGIMGASRDRRPPTRRTAVLVSATVGLVLATFALVQMRGAEAAKAPATAEAGPVRTDGDPFVEAPATASATAKAKPVFVAQVAVESMFIEINESDLKDLDLSQYGTAAPASASSGASPAVNAPPLPWIGTLDLPAVKRALLQKPGAELLSAPSVTVLSGNPASITVGQEIRYPRSYGPPRSTPSGIFISGLPQDFTTHHIGVELGVTPIVAADGHTIDLDLHPGVTEFIGLVEPPGQGVAGGSGSQAAAVRIIKSPPVSANVNRVPDYAGSPPIFSVRETKTSLTVQGGDTVVMGVITGMPREIKVGDAPASEEIKKAVENLPGPKTGAGKRALLVFVTARIISFNPVPVVQAGATPARPVQVALETRLIDVGQNDFSFQDFDFSRYGSASPAPADSNPLGAGIHQWTGTLDVPAVLRAVAQKSGAEILSPPSVTVLSGRPVKINAGHEMRYPVTNYEHEHFGDGPYHVEQGFLTRTIGAELQATATVAADGHTIDLKLNPRVTEFEGFVEYGGPNMTVSGGPPPVPATPPAGVYIQPIFSTREISTTVFIQDGTTLVMGGLTREVVVGAGAKPGEINQVGVQGPILGAKPTRELPKGQSREKHQLLIFVTARIVKPDEVLKARSAVRASQ